LNASSFVIPSGYTPAVIRASEAAETVAK